MSRPNYLESNLQPYQIRFENALKENIVTKCQRLASLIDESIASNIKDIQQRYVLLVEDIFSFSMTSIAYARTDWKLKTVSSDKNSFEFSSILEFLSANGPLFKLIRHLINDNSIRYDFPISCLPTPTRTAFADNIVPNFYTNKITQGFSSSISLNAFEFYLFHFSYFITNHQSKSPQNIIESNLGVENINSIYYALLENYLEAFIPVPSLAAGQSAENNKTLAEGQSLWKSLSSLSTTTSNILNLSHPKHDHVNFANNAASSSFSPSNLPAQISVPSSANVSAMSPFGQKSTLMSSKIFSLGKFQQTPVQNVNLNDNDLLGTPVYKCETTLNIFTEFWLNHVLLSNLEDNRGLKSLSHSNFKLTVDHMRAIRSLVKHLHYFSNSGNKRNSDFNNSSLHTQYNSGGIVTAEINDPLDELRRNLWSSKYLIQKKLYQFLKLAFDRWPNDSSFRAPLETWLSYIQPWRYISKISPMRKQSDELNDSSNSDISEWKRFIIENLFFYTIIFRQVIDRISKILDLNSTSSAFLLFRMTKVFAQNHLCEWIKESELNLLNGGDLAFNFRLHNSTNLLSPSLKHISHSHSTGAPMKHALMEMEPVSVEYSSFFSSSFRDKIINLLMKIAKHLHASESSKQKKNATSVDSKSNTLITAIVNFFSIENAPADTTGTSSVDTSKTKNYLEQSVRFLSSIFDISPQSIETIMCSDKGHVMDETDAFQRDKSAYEMVNGVPKLSEHGRKLILGGSLKSGSLGMPPVIEGNPDTQPVRTFEVEILVKTVLFLSFFINTHCQAFFEKHYHEDSYFGVFLHQILSPPIQYVRYVKTGNGLTTDIVVESLPPRVDLRFIASKSFLFYLLFLLIFCRLFNFSILNIGFLFLTVFISYIATKSMLVHLKM